MSVPTNLPNFHGTVQSEQGPDSYEVFGVNGKLFCSCRGYSKWKHCKHLDSLQLLEQAGTARVVDGVLVIQI